MKCQSIMSLQSHLLYEMSLYLSLQSHLLYEMSLYFFTTESPDAPRHLAVLDTDSDRFNIEWDEPASDGGAPVTWYHVEIRNENDTEFKVSQLSNISCLLTISCLMKGWI